MKHLFNIISRKKDALKDEANHLEMKEKVGNRIMSYKNNDCKFTFLEISKRCTEGLGDSISLKLLRIEFLSVLLARRQFSYRITNDTFIMSSVFYFLLIR